MFDGIEIKAKDEEHAKSENELIKANRHFDKYKARAPEVESLTLKNEKTITFLKEVKTTSQQSPLVQNSLFNASVGGNIIEGNMAALHIIQLCNKEAALKGMLSVNRVTLRHFKYLWFGRLSFNPSTVREDNMAVQAEQLAQDEPLLRLFQEQQREVSDCHIFIQFAHCFFNIHAYVFNTYRLAAYESHREFIQLAQGKENMLSNYVNTTKQATVQSLHWAMNAIYGLLRAGNFPLIYLNEAREEKPLVTVGVSQPSELPDARIGQRFMVKASMLPHLRQLGINRSEGDSLDWSDIRRAFFAKARLAHPDKNGSAEWFRNIKKALDRLEQHIFCEQGESQRKNHTQWQDFFDEAYREFARTMTRIEARIAKTNKGVTELNKRIAELNKGVAEIKTEITELSEGIAEINKGITELNTGIAELNTGIAGLAEKNDKRENDLNKLILRDKEMEKLLLEYAIQNNISLPDELLPGRSSPSKVFTNQYGPGLFSTQPADQSQAELSLAEDSMVAYFPRK